MKLLFPNLNKLDIRCDGRDNAKKQCSSISIVVLSKAEWLHKKREKKMKDIERISIAYRRVHLR